MIFVHLTKYLIGGFYKMKKFLLAVGFLLFATILAGCITIPIGDDMLEISSDGIQFVPKDDDGSNNNNNEEYNANGEDGLENDPDHNGDSVADNENSQGEAENSEGSDESGDNNDANTATPGQECEKQDHSAIFDSIGMDLYIPECAVLQNINKSSDTVTATLELEGRDWAEVFDEFVEFANGTDYDITKEDRNIQNESGDLRYSDESGNRTWITVHQWDEDLSIWMQIPRAK